ncbi:MAG: hypothetical protein HZB56_08110 [Deltaproteobacteria bacterium]|nr:hypothetical protein [Deltaproteobacteria bacterium]
MRLAIAAAALALAACPPPPAWMPGGQPYLASQSGYEALVPADWMRRNVKDRELYLVTRDGLPLQRIEVAITPVGKPVYRGSKRVVAEGMSPQELGELLADALVSGEALAEARVLENAPATVSGRPGFRLLLAFRDGDGLPRRLAIHGVMASGRLYGIVYGAPERHYFNRDLAAYEEVVRSFRLTTPIAPPPPPPEAPATGAAGS